MFGYAYDAAGNLLADGLGDVFTWDAKGRLSSAGGATYVYDPLGNRVGKQGVGLTDTIYFGGRPIARYSAGQWTDLIYGPTGLLAEVPGTQNGSPVYRVSDHLGSTVGNLLADGSFVNPTDYTPFGQVFSGGTNDRFLFTGYERDGESGLDYASARHYASTTGRFMSPDWSASPTPVPYASLTNPQTLNLYAFVRNSPLSYVDTDGHDGCQIEGVDANCAGISNEAAVQCPNNNCNPVNYNNSGQLYQFVAGAGGAQGYVPFSDPTGSFNEWNGQFMNDQQYGAAYQQAVLANIYQAYMLGLSKGNVQAGGPQDVRVRLVGATYNVQILGDTLTDLNGYQDPKLFSKNFHNGDSVYYADAFDLMFGTVGHVASGAGNGADFGLEAL